MPHRLDSTLNLGPALSGLTDLRGQFVDTIGSYVGSAISAGFVELGSGIYLWDCSTIPDNHRGGVFFYSNAAPSVILTAYAVNPEEGEWVDSRVSSIQAGSSLTAGDIENAVWDAATADHLRAGSFGFEGQGIIRAATAQGGTLSTMVLDAGASTLAEFYQGCVLYINAGTGFGQAARMIIAYASDRTATIAPPWVMEPDDTSNFILSSPAQPLALGSDGRALVSADAHASGETVAAVAGEVTVGMNNDKVGYDLADSAVGRIWGWLTSAGSAVGSFGRLLIDTLTAPIDTRMAAADYVAPLGASAVSAAVWDAALGDHLLPLSFGQMNQRMIHSVIDTPTPTTQPFELRMTRGDTFRFNFTATIGGVGQDISDYLGFWFTAKRDVRDLDPAAVVALADTAAGGTGIVRRTPALGICEVTIPPAATAGVSPLGGILFADIKGKTADGDLITLRSGTLIVEPEVTERAV